MPISRNAAVFGSVIPISLKIFQYLQNSNIFQTVVLKKIVENDGYFHILFFYHKIMNMNMKLTLEKRVTVAKIAKHINNNFNK